MLKIVDDRITSNTDPDFLVDKVKECIAQGWQPYGLPYVGNMLDYADEEPFCRHFQTMVKYEEIP